MSDDQEQTPFYTDQEILDAQQTAIENLHRTEMSEAEYRHRIYVEQHGNDQQN